MTDQERTDFIFRTVNTPHQFSYENGITVTHVEPASGKKIFCVATPKKMGRTLSVIQVVLTNDQDVVVATGTFTFFMMD